MTGPERFDWSAEALADRGVDKSTIEEWEERAQALHEEEASAYTFVSPAREAEIENLKQRFDEVSMDAEATCKVYPDEDGIGYDARQRTVIDGTVEVFHEKGEQTSNDDVLEKEVHIDWEGPVIGLRNLEEEEDELRVGALFHSIHLRKNLQEQGYQPGNVDVDIERAGQENYLSVSFALEDTGSVWAASDLTTVAAHDAAGYLEHDISGNVYDVLTEAVAQYRDLLMEECEGIELVYEAKNSMGAITIEDPVPFYDALMEEPMENRLQTVEQYLADNARYRNSATEA